MDECDGEFGLRLEVLVDARPREIRPVRQFPELQSIEATLDHHLPRRREERRALSLTMFRDAGRFDLWHRSPVYASPLDMATTRRHFADTVSETKIEHQPETLKPDSDVPPRVSSWVPSKRRWLWALPLPLVLVMAAHLHGASSPAPTVRAEQRPLAQTVVVSGQVIAPAKVHLGSLARGRVSRVGAQEGDHVEAGTLLVELDDTEARAAVARAEAQIARARATVTRVASHDALLAEQQLRRAESELAVAETRHARTMALIEGGAMPRSEADSVHTALARAREQREAARLALSDARPGGGGQRVASADLLEAEAQLSAARARLKQLRVVAPAPGLILSRNVEIGDVVDPSRVLMVFSVDGPVRLSVQPDERALGSVRVGQPARASTEAFPELTFDARVDWIAPAVDANRGTVEVRLFVDTPPDYLRPDMTVAVTILTGQRQDAVVVPIEAVRDAGSSPYVLVRRDSREQRVPVRLGLRNARQVEILEGLTVGDELIAPPAATQAARQKIHPWD